MFFKKIIVGSFIFISQTSLASACSVCFNGTPNDSMTLALRMGGLALFAILLGVLGVFTKFFIDVKNRTQIKN